MTQNQRSRCTARILLPRGQKNNQPRNLQASRLRRRQRMGGGLDGSSKPLWKGSKYRAGGIGIYSQEDTQTGKISTSEPLPPDLRQTNNVAELGGGGGGVQVLKRVPGDNLAILSDSNYLISGAQGQVHSWREMSWIGPGGGDDQQYLNLGRTVIGNGTTRQNNEVDLCARARRVRGK